MTTIYSKSSFDRFGDDLCEDILSYFPFEDRIKYECVSQQWKRTVYQRVNNLIINLNNGFTKQFFTTNQTNEGLPAFESFLRKCPNITHFSIEPNVRSTFWWLGHSHNRIFELIVKYCNYLKSIDNSLYLMTYMFGNTLLEPFGHKLESIKLDLGVYTNTKINFQTYGKLRRLQIQYMSKLIFGETDESSFPFKGLTHLKVSPFANKGDDMKTLGIIIRSNKRLKCLDINFRDHKQNLLPIKDLLTDISDLTQLKSFRLNLSCDVQSKEVLKSFQMIGQKCLKLEKLVINDLLGDQYYLKSFINMVKYYPNLIHFQLIGCNKSMDCEGAQIGAQPFANCPHMQHLSLSILGLGGIFFEDIHKYVPKLRHLTIHKSKVSVAIFTFLESLPDLQKVVIQNMWCSGVRQIDPKLIKQLFNNCSRLKSLTLITRKYTFKFYRTYPDGLNQFFVKLL